MSQPIEITEDYLFAKIGRLVVENDVLRAQLAQAQPQAAPEPPDEPEHT